MKIAVIVAMDKELQQLHSFFHSRDIFVSKSGIGKVNAAIKTLEIIKNFSPDVIISSGCAGGNGEGVNIQDIVVSTELAYHDAYCGKADNGSTQYGQIQGLPARFKADPKLLIKAHDLAQKNPHLNIHQGVIVTGDYFVDSKEKMREIISKFPEAKAVDMESCAIAHTCYLYNVPFISMRVVSDIPLKDTNASGYFNFWDTIAEKSFEFSRNFIESL